MKKRILQWLLKTDVTILDRIIIPIPFLILMLIAQILIKKFA